tara:strand:- start:690 stop:1109 length:420 start_codon:yes stop_codon:yes gene_type:complete
MAFEQLAQSNAGKQRRPFPTAPVSNVRAQPLDNKPSMLETVGQGFAKKAMTGVVDKAAAPLMASLAPAAAAPVAAAAAPLAAAAAPLAGAVAGGTAAAAGGAAAGAGILSGLAPLAAAAGPAAPLVLGAGALAAAMGGK